MGPRGIPGETPCDPMYDTLFARSYEHTQYTNMMQKLSPVS